MSKLEFQSVLYNISKFSVHTQFQFQATVFLKRRVRNGILMIKSFFVHLQSLLNLTFLSDTQNWDMRVIKSPSL